MPPEVPSQSPTLKRSAGGLFKRFLLGRRLASEEAGHQLLPKLLALPVFASDALSSVSYATEEIFLVLILAGPILGQHLGISLPIAGGVALLMVVVVTSYRQTAMAYPRGGGAYVVSRENLGTLPGLIAGGALLTDYILTVAVSIAAGSFAIASLVPALLEHRVALSIGFIILITIMNLRGTKESGALFAGPTYLFVISMFLTLAYGLYQCSASGCPDAGVGDFEAPEQLKTLSLFLVARAFSSGATALTGVEAIVDGVPAFRGRRPEDQARNAATTLAALGAIAVPLFLGITYLANRMGALPTHQKSIVAQIADGVWGGGFGFIAVQIVTCAILVLAANTAYQDFPRLASVLARDRFLPRQFMNQGDRLVFSNGILVLATAAIGLIIAYDAEVTRLIQLYVLGVFTSFTLSQAGMVQRWRRLRPEGWKKRATVNGIGASVTGFVFVVVAISKFLLGAWLIVVTVFFLVLLFLAINRHYRSVAVQLREEATRSKISGTTVVIPVGEIDEATLQALGYARAMRPRHIVAVHVGTGPHAQQLQAQWEALDIPVPLEFASGSLTDPVEGVRAFLRSLRLEEGEVATLLLPELYERTGTLEVLKRRKALRLKAGLLYEPRVVVTDVPVLATGSTDKRLRAPSRVIGVVLVSQVHNATRRAVDYAATLSPTNLRAVTFNIDPEETMRIVETWVGEMEDVALEAVDSPYRSVTRPLLRYVRELRAANPDAIVSVVVPEFVVKKFWHQALHNQTAFQIKKVLLFEPGVTLTSVPFHLK
ncbi:MAG: APC family permease [Actinomycetota bacterium]